MKRKLVKAVALGLLLGFSSIFATQTASAEVDANGLQSTRDETIYIDGQPFAIIHYFENGSVKYNGSTVKLTAMPKATYGQEMQTALNYWSQVLGLPKAGVPEINVYGLDINSLNASASSNPDNRDGNTNTRLANYFLLDNYSGIKPIARINIYTGYKDWDFGDLAVLPQTEKVNLAAVLVHEMFHALGVTSGKSSSWNLNSLGSGGVFPISDAYKPSTTFDTYLTDMYGHKLSACNFFYVYDAAKNTETFSVYKNIFYLTTNTSKTAEARYGGVYFTGKNVQNVLNGATLAWPDDDDGHLGRVAGIPINGIELNVNKTDASKSTFKLELSHFELQNSLQSHQSYRNWEIPMEVELAAMQDFGYNIDLSKYYGRSIYNDDLTLTNTVGYQQAQDYGIGLHVYGIGNTINQAADILADGAYAMGIRVDGAGYTNATSAKNDAIKSRGNSITVAAGTTVAADGYKSRGVNFAYGKNHNLTVDGTVTALGTDGRAICFDFGDNAAANAKEARGSYLRTRSGKEAALLAALAGPLVNQVTINGTVAGSDAAIYISNNALVKTININDGAYIQGNIISDWQNTGVVGLQLPADEDGMTTLNFGTLSYAGDITNSQNNMANTLNLCVQGALDYLGTAKVNQVTVASGGKLCGGSYTTEQGVVNNGTIGAARPTDTNTTQTINGDLLLKHESTVQFTGNVANNGYKTGLVAVNGTVTQEGNVKVTVDEQGKYLPGSYSVLQEQGTDVALKVADSNASVYAQGLLQATYNTETKNIVFALKDNDKLLTGEQNRAVQALDAARMSNPAEYAGLSATEQERYATFLNSSDKALIQGVAQELTSNANTQAIQAVQQGNLVGRMVGARLASVNRAKVTVPVQVTPKSLLANKGAAQQTVTTKITVPVEPEQSFWAKLDKSWGNAGSMNLHSTGLTFGYDKQYQENSRAGVLFSYGDGSVSGAQRSDKIKDYRLGFYHNYHRGANDMTVYLDYGQQRHDAKHYTFLQDSKNTYDSRILELGAEYKHDLHAEDGKVFHVAPYVNGQASRYWQDSYNEGMLSKNVNAYNGNYLATEAGVELSRYFTQGSYSARLGYKHVWDGASTVLNYNLGSMGFKAKSELDANFVTASLTGSTKLNKHGWSLEGDAHIEKGAHDKNYGVSATLKWEW